VRADGLRGEHAVESPGKFPFCWSDESAGVSPVRIGLHAAVMEKPRVFASAQVGARLKRRCDPASFFKMNPSVETGQRPRPATAATA